MYSPLLDLTSTAALLGGTALIYSCAICIHIVQASYSQLYIGYFLQRKVYYLTCVATNFKERNSLYLLYSNWTSQLKLK
jgi:hypothetical protein